MTSDTETRRGIVLAGGTGTRLCPMTRAVSKQLLPVYDKPLVYYPLTTLMLAGVRECLIITTPADTPQFRKLLGDGSAWGLTLAYATQDEPRGIAEALIIAEPFLDGRPSVLVLGDNLFFGHGLGEVLAAADRRRHGATIFAYRVSEPGHYGVVELAADGAISSLEEKPARPRSNLAVTGLYYYDGEAPALARALRPSARGELEVTDLNRAYLARGDLSCEPLGRGFAWLDTGTPEALLEAATFVHTLQKRQGLLLASPEEVAFRKGWIDAAALLRLGRAMGGTAYGQVLEALAREAGA